MGRKPVELRSWPTGYRGPVLIHAGKTTDKLAAQSLGLDPDNLVTGAIVGVATLSDCRAFTEEDAEMLRRRQAYAGSWLPGLYAWELRDVRRVRAQAFRGRLGLFDVPDDLELLF